MKLDATDGALKISTKIKKTLPPVHRKASGLTLASGCRGKRGQFLLYALIPVRFHHSNFAYFHSLHFPADKAGREEVVVG